MSRKSVVTGWHVEVLPRRLGDFGVIRMSDNAFGYTDEQIARDYKERCEEIVREIRRHVENVGSASVIETSEARCSHCGRGWTEDSDAYNGGCCDKDEEGNPEIAAEPPVVAEEVVST